MKLIPFLMPALAAMVVFVQTSDPKGDESGADRTVKAAAGQSGDSPKSAGDEEDEKQDEADLAGFMHKKLKATNRIMEGLCIDDPKLVEAGATALLKMSDAEQWRASNDIMYLNHSKEFTERVKTLRDKAKAHNSDGAALAWMEVTMSCFRCHSWVRDSMLVDAGTGLDPVQKIP